MNVVQLENTDYIIFKAIVGSKLYGLDTPSSDTDIKGVYNLPLTELLKSNYQTQVNDEKNDQVFYEVIKFLNLARKANPNTLELLYIPKEFILKKDIIFDLILEQKDIFLTKAIKNSLGGYAIAQIKKARGKNKKIINPIGKERKTLIDFCYILGMDGSKPLNTWLNENNFTQDQFGVSNIDVAHNVFYIYHNRNKYDYRGIAKKYSNEIRLSNIPKETIGNYDIIYFASENYSRYCKNYKEYWEWIENRNESRYISVEKHNKGYDGKHLMHCFRLLDMGIDAAKYGELIVKRPNKQWLLDVREGKFEYKDLIAKAEDKLLEMEENIEKSNLPDSVSEDFINKLLLNIRNIK